jgi:hypothetical protein
MFAIETLFLLWAPSTTPASDRVSDDAKSNARVRQKAPLAQRCPTRTVRWRTQRPARLESRRREADPALLRFHGGHHRGARFIT